MGRQRDKDAESRRRLLSAARSTFARVGFHEARLTDVAKCAGVAISTFYRFYPSKKALFNALYVETIDSTYVKSLLHDTLTEPFLRGDDPSDPMARIRIAVRQILVSYRADNAILDIMEQLASVDEECRELYLDLRSHAVAGLAEFVQAAQQAGLASTDVEPIAASRAMLSMISNSCHMWFTLHEPYDEELAVETLATFWAGGLGIAPLD